MLFRVGDEVRELHQETGTAAMSFKHTAPAGVALSEKSTTRHQHQHIQRYGDPSFKFR